MQLRDYQQGAVDSIYTYFQKKSGHPVIALPTGTGKSHVIADFITTLYKNWPNQRVMMLTHVKELIEQNHEKLLQHWPTAPAGIYSAGLNRKDVSYPITYAGIASVAKKAEYFGHVDLILIDECHLVSPTAETMYASFISALTAINPHLKVIGLTATPYRLGLGLITEGNLFTDICYDLTGMKAFNKLIDDGYLATLVPKRTQVELDVSGVKIHGGEFVQKQLQETVDKDEITYAAIQEAREIGHDRKCWLVFATGIDHAEHITAMLDSLDIPATCVHSKLKKEERDQRIRDYKAGKYRAMVNSNVLTTGFDHPPIDLILMLKPTSSTALWIQMLGRGTRPFELKENCMVLDYAGNTKRLGPINDPTIPRRKGKKGGTAPVRLCAKSEGGCDTYIHASLRICPHCSKEFPPEVKIKAFSSEAELVAKDDPVVEIFKVNRVVYGRHRKVGKPDAILVTYSCGLRRFKEYVCIEHSGFAGKKARDWWRERSGAEDLPDSTDLALEYIEHVKVPTHIRVWINKKYPEILTYDYSGTAFGTTAAHPPAAQGDGDISVVY